MTASSYNVCIYTQPKPLILCGNVFEGRVLKQSESYKRVTNYLRRLYSPLFTRALANTTMEMVDFLKENKDLNGQYSETVLDLANFIVNSYTSDSE